MQPVESALDVALIVLRNGGSTAMAERAFRNVLEGHGQEGVSAVWRMDFVAARVEGDGSASTILRPVGTTGTNLSRASEAVLLGERVARGEVPETALASEIERIHALAPPYGRWLLVGTAGFTSACFARLIGGDWGAVAIAFVAAALGQSLRGMLQARKLAVARVTFLCGLLSACTATAGLRLGLSQVEPGTMLGSIIYLVPGLSLINGTVDVLSHRHLPGGLERIASAAFLFVVLAIAIALAYAIFM